jgi:oxygen-independent coproporphyrinogen-3 oxidase
LAGIYIHIPFCKQPCTYCNFHFSVSLKQKENLIASINKEILLTPLFATGSKQIDSIYIGGGTPSLLTADEIKTIFETLHKKFNVNVNAEITLEANPDDISKSMLSQWQQVGINRLSLGIQSFSESELLWMNRAHNASEALNSINKIQEAGFKNFSVDLIYGSPLSGNDVLKKNVEILFKMNVPHVSCYALTVEPKTKLYKMIGQQKSIPVDSEKQAEQFLLLMDLMKQGGYEHYEISNYAKPGMRSKHNSSYWQGKAYYGFGPSAHSFDGKKTRRWNIANNSLYIQSLAKDLVPFEEEILTETQQLNEYIMTSLRTKEGLELKQVSSSFGKNNAERLYFQSRKYIDSNKMILEDEKMILTREGKLFADGIAADLFF